MGPPIREKSGLKNTYNNLSGVLANHKKKHILDRQKSGRRQPLTKQTKTEEKHAALENFGGRHVTGHDRVRFWHVIGKKNKSLKINMSSFENSTLHSGLCSSWLELATRHNL